MQEGVCKAIGACAVKKALVVKEVVKSVIHQHREPRYFERILAIAADAEVGKITT